MNFQNGLGFEEEIEKEFSENLIVGGLCFLCKIGPGHVRHLDYGAIKLASHNFKKWEQQKRDVDFLKEILTRSNIENNWTPR